MIYPEKTITLKDGQKALLRSPRKEDAADMLDYMKTCYSQTDYLIRYPEEMDITVENEAAFLGGIVDSDSQLMIVCEIDGRIAGNCSLTRHNKIKTSHRADVAIALIDRYCSLGIGTKMFDEMIAAAKKLGIEQLELEVVEGNDRAIGLYKKMGFGIYGERPDSIRLKDGTVLKEFLMVRKV